MEPSLLEGMENNMRGQYHEVKVHPCSSEKHNFWFSCSKPVDQAELQLSNIPMFLIYTEIHFAN